MYSPKFDNRGYRVTPRSRQDISNIASEFRDIFNISQPDFPIVPALDTLVNTGEIELIVCTQKEMDSHTKTKGIQGFTLPKKNTLFLNEDVMQDAYKGKHGIGMGRFTIAHELGHMLMHKQETAYARTKLEQQHKVYEDSEWQANTFAASLLIDEKHVIESDTISDIQDRFIVSYSMARIAHGKLSKKGKIKSKALCA